MKQSEDRHFRLPTVPVIALLRLYQLLVSPVLHGIMGPGSGCRFHPTCSHYGIEAFRLHGLVGGTWLTCRRLLRCHPWGGSGEDPVPRKIPSLSLASRYRRPSNERPVQRKDGCEPRSF